VIEDKKVMKETRWKCFECNRINKMDKDRCFCGYVKENLQFLEDVFEYFFEVDVDDEDA
jgi:hypothetical protein